MNKGTVSVNTENIFPIIKKWLYSDKDIFLRELISNACDAITKVKKLSAMGNAEIADGENFKIDVILNKENKTITISDNGVGMTEDEVINYIANVAFSGAEEFAKKYQQDENEDSKIIGHFGLGFYSAFMVSEKVDIYTKSFEKNSKGVLWTCDGSTEYETNSFEKENRGTDIVLHIAEDSKEFLELDLLTSTVSKYCGFFPVEIFVYEEGKKAEKPVNDTEPLWLKNPSECTDEEYKAFYKKVFMDFNDPLFYIHLNVEYPFNLKGILYFPKLSHELQANEGEIKLFNNQVFVADNVKEIIPEFLLLLKGVVDCPDMPLNVSRSFLQNDGYASKVSAHITKKVADKLCALFNTERENYDKCWDDIAPFVKYGCLREEKFYDKVSGIIIYKTTDDRHVLLSEYLDKAKLSGHENEVYYVSDPLQQTQYTEMLKSQNISAVILPAMIDGVFINFLETKNEGVKFKRVDSAISSALKNENDNKNEKLIETFKTAIGNEQLKIESVELKSDSVPAVLLISEESRRMQEMMRMYGNMGMNMDAFPADITLSLNTSHPLIKAIGECENSDTVKLICQQIYDNARLAQAPLDSKSISDFITRSTEIMNLALNRG